MSGGINFGSLTIFINGRAVNLSDYDDNGDGKLQGDELKRLQDEFELDTFNLKTVDRNGDEQVTADEFLIWGERIKMEDLLRQLFETKLSLEFIGELAPYQSVVKDELRDMVNDLINGVDMEYVRTLAKNFEEILPEKYEEIKARCLAEINSKDDTNTVYLKLAEETVEEVYLKLLQRPISEGVLYGDKLTDSQKALIKDLLKTESLAFIKIYEGGESSFVYALTEHLIAYMEASEKSLMGDKKSDWDELVGGLGEYISQNEFAKIKNQANKVLLTAVEAGIKIYYNGELITSENVNKILDLYSREGTNGNDAQALINLINSVLENLSDKSRLNAIAAGETNEIRVLGPDVQSGAAAQERPYVTGSRLSQMALDMVDKVIDNLYAEYIDLYSAQKSSYKKEFGNVMEKAALVYMEAHPYATEEELTKYLRGYMAQTVYGAMQVSINRWQDASKGV